MNKVYILLLILIAGVFQLGAQNKPDKKQMLKEVQEYRMKYLAQEMELKENQKKKFFDLYSEMSVKRRQCFKKVKELENKLKKNSNASEQEYQELTESLTNAKAEAAAIEKEYDDKFSEFLTQKQIYKMKEAEKEFAKKAEAKIADRKKGHNGKPQKK